MTVFKSGIFLIFVLIEQSTQFSISSEMNSESPPSSNQTGCLKTIGQCLRLMPNELSSCAFEHAVNNIDCIIASNKTWHFNEFIVLKKNDEWKQNDVEARHDRSLFETLLSKLSDLIASRSIQFSIPQDELSAEGRVKSGFDYSGLTSFVGNGFGPGKKQSDFQYKIYILQITALFIWNINTIVCESFQRAERRK